MFVDRFNVSNNANFSFVIRGRNLHSCSTWLGKTRPSRKTRLPNCVRDDQRDDQNVGSSKICRGNEQVALKCTNVRITRLDILTYQRMYDVTAKLTLMLFLSISLITFAPPRKHKATSTGTP